MTAWRAKDTGTYPTTITFQLATGITDDGEGGVASGLTEIKVHVRLKPISQSGQRQEANQVFPGTDSPRELLLGWVNDPSAPTFPNALRGWLEFPVGDVEFAGQQGRIEVQVKSFAIPGAVEKIGERFIARWTPS